MDGSTSKIVLVAEAAEQIRSHQTAGRRVVLCHGCFDIVHPGHIRHLQHARSHGDVLAVSITSDAHVGKGPGRPFIPEPLRAENLAVLDFVDLVTVNPRPTATDLITDLRPDVYVKGREYEHNQDERFLEERRAVESYGGRVVFSSGEVIFSSTELIRSLTNQCSSRGWNGSFGPAGDLASVIDGMAGRSVLVVGAVLADTYISCDQPEVTTEGPMLTLRPLKEQQFDGGAAIVARHLAAMGASPTLLTAMSPDDPLAMSMADRLREQGVLVETIACAEPIGEKQRYIVGTQKVMKVDRGRAITLDAAQQAQMLDRAAALAAQCDACIVLDYGRGMMSASTLTRLCRAVRPHVDRLVGDVSGRRSNLQSMHEMDLLCPSESELREAMQDYEDGLNAVVWRMLEQSQSASAIVTLGEDGLVAFDQPNARAPRTSVDRLRSHHVPSLSRTCVDPLGCGDALIAAATLAHLHTGDLRTAATLGALAASIEINQLGNVPVSADDLREHLQPTPFDHIEPKAVTSAYPEVTQQTAAQV